MSVTWCMISIWCAVHRRALCMHGSTRPPPPVNHKADHKATAADMYDVSLCAQAPEAKNGELSTKVDSFAFGLVILEAVTGLGVMLSEAPKGRKLPPTKEKTLLALWYEELCESPTKLNIWLDAAWEELALTILHGVISSCLLERRKARCHVADVLDVLNEVCSLLDPANHSTREEDTMGDEEGVCVA